MLEIYFTAQIAHIAHLHGFRFGGGVVAVSYSLVPHCAFWLRGIFRLRAWLWLVGWWCGLKFILGGGLKFIWKPSIMARRCEGPGVAGLAAAGLRM
jgi:hypothetical protein